MALPRRIMHKGQVYVLAETEVTAGPKSPWGPVKSVPKRPQVKTAPQPKRVHKFSKHDKCADGTHWNEVTKKCEKVDSAMVHDSKKAFHTSHSLSRPAKLPKSRRSGEERRSWHSERADAHWDAASAHMDSASNFIGSGHYDLAHAHEMAADHHAHKTDAHMNKANSGGYEEYDHPAGMSMGRKGPPQKKSPAQIAADKARIDRYDHYEAYKKFHKLPSAKHENVEI